MSSRRKHKNSRNRPAPGPQAVTQTKQDARAWALPVGGLALGLSIVAGGMLVLQHFGGMSLPGCGPGSACAKLTSGAWGSVPWIGWPVSFLGLTYFLAMLAAWIVSRGVLAMPLRVVTWISGVASLMFLIVMVAQGELCYYCLLSHVGNLAFVGIAEVSRRGVEMSASRKQWIPLHPVAAMIIVFILGSVALWGAQVTHQRDLAMRAEQDLDESIRRAGGAAQVEEELEPFTGRYLYGPENAPIRLVMFTGYQCPDCQRVDREIIQLLQQRDDVSLSIKHFPMNADCNPYMRGQRTHGNACWAARAAEAAGIIGGQERFWEMHHWLVNRGGSFTDAEIAAALREMGYDVRNFLEVMSGVETLRRVQADIEEAIALGLHFTPMIFLNGVELRGWQAVNAVTRAVERVAAGGDGLERGRPVSAYQKHIDDWAAQMRLQIPPAAAHRQIGATSESVRIELWGDYDTPTPAQVESMIRNAMATRPDVTYSFRAFPIDQSCNPASPITRSEQGCIAAQAAEAAGVLGGSDGFQRMHRWLLENTERLSEANIIAAAVEMGFERNAFEQTMRSPQVAEAIRRDAEAARALVGTVRSATMLYVNGRGVPRWNLEGHDVIGGILDEAARAAREVR